MKNKNSAMNSTAKKLKSNTPAAASGMSIIEVLIALTLVTIAAVGTFQLVSTIDKNFINARSDLNEISEEAALGSIAYDAFIEDNLSANPNFTSTDIAELSDVELVVSELMGASSRVSGNLASCRLANQANLTTAQIAFNSDCVVTSDNQTIAQAINNITQQGSAVTFALDGSGGLCSVSKQIDNSSIGQIASLTVDDVACLSGVGGIAAPVESEIFFPRYFVSSATQASPYATSYFDDPTEPITNLAIIAPQTVQVDAVAAHEFNDVGITSLRADQNTTVTLSTTAPSGTLAVGNSFGGSVADNGTATITLTGTIDQVHRMMETLTYTPPAGFFGVDPLNIRAVTNQLLANRTVALVVSANCGGMSDVTAVRLDVGNWDNATSTFNVSRFVTALSRLEPHKPTYYYGYCNSNTTPTRIYDQSSGVANTVSSCPSGYTNWTGKLTDYDDNSVTVFLYEETGPSSYTRDRFSFFVLFEGKTPQTHCENAPPGLTLQGRLAASRASGMGLLHSDAVALGQLDRGFGSNSYCHVEFQMDNLEANRPLDNSSDPYVLLDDVPDHSSQIDSLGRFRSQVVMKPTADGAIIPLRLPNQSFSATNLPELSDYAQDPDGDGNSNPMMRLIYWDSVQDWRIFAAEDDGSSAGFREFSVTAGTTDAIQVRITSAQRCPS